MFNIFKRSFRDKQEMTVDGVELWSVRWTSIKGEYSSDKEQVAEFFTNKEAADEFEKALKDAFKLTRNCLNSVQVRKESAS